MLISRYIYEPLIFPYRPGLMYSQTERTPMRAEMERFHPPVVLKRGGDEAPPASGGPAKEEARRHAALQTTLPMTGHSLATRSALNSPDSAPKTQHRCYGTT